MASFTGGGGGGAASASADAGSSDDNEFIYEDEILEKYEGKLQVSMKIVRAFELIDRGTSFDKQDPALLMSVGSQSKKTERQKDAGR